MLEDRQPDVPGVPQSPAGPLAGVAPMDADALSATVLSPGHASRRIRRFVDHGRQWLTSEQERMQQKLQTRRQRSRMVDAGFLVQAQRPRTSNPDNQAALRLIGLAALIHMLRSPRFYERVIVSAIVLAALARLGQENGTSTFERLAAWNKQQVQRLSLSELIR